MNGVFKSLIKLVTLLVALAGVFILGQFFTGTTYWNNAAWNKLLKEQALLSRPEVGKVVKRKGVAKAGFQDDDRSLNVGDVIREGDRLQTGLLSRLRIEFNDGAILTLGEETLFLVEKYPAVPDGKLLSRASVGDLLIPPAHAEEELPQPVVTMKRGVFSYASGLMAKWLKSKHSSMTVFTPVATMGIRGTTLWSHLKEINRTGQGIPERSLDVLCMVPSCSVNKGGDEKVMDVPNTGLATSEVQTKLPDPVLSPPEKVVQAQVSTVVPKDLPTPMVEKLQKDMLNALNAAQVGQGQEETLQIVQSTLDTLVGRTELRMAAKALREIQEAKPMVSTAEIQKLLEVEAQKTQPQEQYFKNVEELMKLKEGQQRVGEVDRETVEKMEFSKQQMEDTIQEVVTSATREVKKSLNEGKSVQDLLQGVDFLKEKIANDPLLTPPEIQLPQVIEKIVEVTKETEVSLDEIRRQIAAERAARLEAETMLEGIRRELADLLNKKMTLEQDLRNQLAISQKLQDELDWWRKKKWDQAGFSPTGDFTLEEEPVTDDPYAPYKQIEANLTLLNRLFTEPELLSKIESLQTDPEFKRALESDELRLLLAQGRYARAVFHPDFQTLLHHPIIQELVSMTRQIQDETYAMGTLTGNAVYAGATTTGSGVTDLTEDYDAMLSTTGQ